MSKPTDRWQHFTLDEAATIYDALSDSITQGTRSREHELKCSRLASELWAWRSGMDAEPTAEQKDEG